MKIESIDHLVLTVRDIDKTCAFYEKVLGMQTIALGDNRKALSFGNQKINLHEYGNEFEPKAEKPCPGSADICFVTTSTIAQAIAHLKSCGVELIEEVSSRTGAKGSIVSVYFRDPDMNLIEIAKYESV